MFPAYQSKASRLQTFQRFEKDFAISVDDLAAAGLFRAGLGDRTTCFASGCGLSNWDKDDNPLEEHKQWFPNCKWAELMATDPDSVMCFEDCPAVSIVIQLGYSKDSVHRAYRRMGRNNPSTGELLDILFKKEEEEPPEEKEESEKTQERSESSHICRNIVDVRAARANAEECERLRKRLADLEMTFECRLCGANADMCGLPCGHIAHCETCVYKSNRCPICNTLVRGVVKTYRV